MLEDVRAALRSVVAIPVTPFNRTGALDEAAYTALLTRLLSAGITTLTPNGNTGEFYSLTPDELTRALTLTLTHAEKGVTVIAGVGFDVRRAVTMAAEAAALGAPAVMVHQPVHPYQSERGWIDYHRAVAEAVPETGVVPYVRSARVSARTLAELAERCPNVVGVKYAVPDVVRFAAVAAAVEQLTWVCGLAETWAPFYWMGGAEGFTSGLVSIAPEASLEMLTALREQDRRAAMDVWRRVKPIEDLRARHESAGNVSVIKEALAQLGLCGRAVRPPISELSQDERAEVGALLHALKLL